MTVPHLQPPRTRLLVRLVPLAALALLAALGAIHVLRSRGDVSVPAAVVLRRGNGPEPESLDPHGARSEAALTLLRDLYEGLTEIGADGAPRLAAADRCDLSADGRTYTFHVRAQARWSNGEPLSAEDFAAAWRRLVDPHTAAPYAGLLDPVQGAAAILRGAAAPSTLGVSTDGADRLIVRLARPTPYFLSILAHPAAFPLNRAALARFGRGFARPGVMVSNGAFVAARWDFGSHIVAVRNRRYWNDAATRLDGVEYYSMTDPDMELRAFRSGALDVTSTIPSAQFAWIRAHLGRQLQLSPELGVYYLGLNLRREPFADAPGLRRALSMVIDRERLVQMVTGGGEQAAYSFVPPSTFGYSPPRPDYQDWPMPRRISAARRLLAEAARPPKSVELSYNSGELHGRIAVAVARMWKEALGIDTVLRAEEFKVLLQDIDRGNSTQVFRASWLADYDDAYGFLRVLDSGFGINLPRYSNPVYDGLLARAAAQADPAGRQALLQQAEATMLADQPLIPLYFYVAKHLVSDSVGGWRANPMNVVYSKQLSKNRVQIPR